MNDDQFDDLKQFIDSRISQSEQLIRGDLRRLEQKVDDGFAGIAETIEQINQRLDSNDEQLNTHEQRLTKLERRTA